jgi:hypothetical protein
MIITYENVTPSLIPNTIMHKMYIDGIHKTYDIFPVANYLLHDNTLNTEVYNEATFEVIETKFGYSPSSVYVSCGANYDFTPHTVTDENGNIYTAYGNRDFFSIPEHFKGEERNV